MHPSRSCRFLLMPRYMWAMDSHDKWWHMPSTQQGSVASTLAVSLEWILSWWTSVSPVVSRQRCCVSTRMYGNPRWISPYSHDPLVVTGSKESPAGLVPPVPGLRTESPQPVSSTRRRLSTDEMQLREVGKLAVYLWKIQWLQRPRPWALPLAWDSVQRHTHR